MNILHFTASLHTGGRERQVVECLKGLSAKKDLSCELALMSHDIHYTAVKDLKIRIHYLIRRTRKDLRPLKTLYEICSRFNPDIIHAWDSMASAYALPIAKILGIKFVNGMVRDAMVKSSIFDKHWVRSRLTFPFSDAIVSNSYAGLKSYHVPPRKCCCIYNGFDIDRIANTHDREMVKSKYDIETQMVVGMVATFSGNKDYETYISAAQMVLAGRKDVTFLAIGDGPTFDKCRRQVSPLFRDRIIFLGRRKNIEALVNVFDIGVLASRSEGISNTVMEYMAMGKPVIATDSGGTRELVLHNKTGFLVNMRDEKDMYLRIIQLLENTDLASTMGIAGKERICTAFSLDKMTDSFVRLYRNILKEADNKMSSQMRHKGYS